MIKRKPFKMIKKAMDEYVIPILFGLRRIGKTTLLKQIKEEYLKNNKELKIKIISWDSFDLQSMNDLNFYHFIISECENNDILLFDEIQDRKGWDIMIKNIFDQFVDNKKCKVVITGSSSLILSGKELGLNRTRRIYIDTWDFNEYLELTKKEKNINNFEEFLGRGFPHLMKEESINYLDQLNDVLKPIILEDVGRAYPKIDIFLLVRLLFHISKLTNGEVNESSISRATKITIPTIRKHMDILVETNLIKRIYKIHENGQFPKNKKYKCYLNPHFHIWLLGKSFNNLDSKIQGHIIESYWLHWALSLNNFRKEFYYLQDLKTNKEIDFVSLNPDGSFKTLHEFKYRNKINLSDVEHLFSIKSTNKVIWSKNKDNDLGIKAIPVWDINDDN